MKRKVKRSLAFLDIVGSSLFCRNIYRPKPDPDADFPDYMTESWYRNKIVNFHIPEGMSTDFQKQARVWEQERNEKTGREKGMEERINWPWRRAACRVRTSPADSGPSRPYAACCGTASRRRTARDSTWGRGRGHRRRRWPAAPSRRPAWRVWPSESSSSGEQAVTRKASSSAGINVMLARIQVGWYKIC